MMKERNCFLNGKLKMKIKEFIGVELIIRKETEGCRTYNKASFLFKDKYKDVERNHPTSYR